LVVKKDDVRHIASLAKLRFDDAEMNTMLKDMQGVLDYIARLETIKRKGADSPVPGVPAGRIDSVVPGLSVEEALDPAPDVQDGRFSVPKII